MNNLPAVHQPPAVDAYADVLPAWLNYLIAAFPTARLAENTFAVYEDVFSNEDPAVMRQAARAAVRASVFFPSVRELAAHVRRQREQRSEWDGAEHLRHRRESQTWPTCPVCGEHVRPDWATCPACADLARMTREDA